MGGGDCGGEHLRSDLWDAATTPLANRPTACRIRGGRDAVWRSAPTRPCPGRDVARWLRDTAVPHQHLANLPFQLVGTACVPTPR